MRLRAVVFGRTSEIGPSTRYRFAQYRDHLRALGIDLEIRPLFGATWFRILRVRSRWLRACWKALYVPVRFAARIVQILTLGRPDRVIVEHQLFPYLPVWFERLALRRGRRFVLEFDDAIWLTPLHRKKLETLCRIADLVVVGNRRLREFAITFNPRVIVLPTAVDTARYQPAVARSTIPSAAAPFVIGWIGLPYNFAALERLAEPLARLAREVPLVVRVISSGVPTLADVALDCVEWSESREAAELERCDVGVMPLPDDEWARGKCALKVLQYFAAGLPVVASPVGMNADVIQDDVNGLLARDADDWIRQLGRLARDRALRERLGRAGRATAEREFDVTVVAPRVAAAWRSAEAWR